jgi:hypothetical protein
MGKRRRAVENEVLASILAKLRRREIQTVEKRLIPMVIESLEARFGEKLSPSDPRVDELAAPVFKRAIDQWDEVSKVLPELIALAGIPRTKYEGFCLAMQKRLRERYYPSIRDQKLREAERSLRAAQDAIMGLSDEQRYHVGIAILVISDFDPALNWIRATGVPNDWIKLIPMMLKAIAEFTGDRPARRGPLEDLQSLFIQDLWRIARHHGGDFTVYANPYAGKRKNRASGSMVEALQLLRPLLPPNFLPHEFSASTLKKLRGTPIPNNSVPDTNSE